MVEVGGYGQSRYLVVEAYCLDAGKGVREDSQPWVIFKSSEGRVYGHYFGSHNGVGFLASCGVDEYRGVRWDVYHCSTQSRLPFDVRTICVDPFFWGELGDPGHWDWWGIRCCYGGKRLCILNPRECPCLP